MSLEEYNEEKGERVAKNRDYRLPDFSLDKRIKGLEVEEIKIVRGRLN